MTDRQAFALAHPFSGGGQDITPYRLTDPQPDGNLLTSILAVDR